MDTKKLPIYIGLAIIIIVIIYYNFKEHYSSLSFNPVTETNDPVRFHTRKQEQYNEKEMYYNGYIIPNFNDNISAHNKFLKGIRDYNIDSTLIYTNELKK